MRYLPKSPADREAMLKAIGARSIDDLFAPIPAEYRLNRDLKIPRQMAESEIVDWFRQRSRENGDGYASFPGRRRLLSLPPGHHRFADLARRVSDRLHALSGGDFAGHAAGHLRIPDHDLRADRHGSGQRFHVRRFDRRRRSRDDGGAPDRPALGGRRAQRASRISRGAGDLRASSGHAAGDVRRSATTAASNLKELEKAITPETACVLIQSPNFFGTIEDVAAIAEIAHKNGAMLVVSIAEAVSLGIVEPPRAGRHHRHGSAVFRRAARLRRSLLRRDRHPRKIRPPDARTPRRPDHRHATASADSF